MLRRITLSVTIGAAVIACAERTPEPPASQPQHALLEGLEPPPLNRPVQLAPAAQEQVTLRLPPGNQAALLVVQGGRPFSGTVTDSGQITVSDSLIRLTPTEGASIEILYRVPAGLPRPASGDRTGSATVMEMSGPAASNRQLIVRGNGRLVLAEVWQTSDRPITIDLGRGLQLVQRATRQAATGEYAEAQLQVLERSQVLATIPLGEPTRVGTSADSIAVFVEVSHLMTPSDADVGQVQGGYILHAWVVPTR